MQPQTDGCWGCAGDGGGQPCQSTLISNYTECTSIKAVHDFFFFFFSLECILPLARLAFDYLKSNIMNIGELLCFFFSFSVWLIFIFLNMSSRCGMRVQLHRGRRAFFRDSCRVDEATVCMLYFCFICCLSASPHLFRISFGTRKKGGKKI